MQKTLIVFCFVQGILTTLLFNSGCATTSPTARPAGDFSETRLSPTVFRVAYRGYSSVTSEQNLDLTLLRACQLVKERGVFHFAIIDEESSRTGQSVYYPGLNHFVLNPYRGLVIQCFEERPKRVFSFDCGKLEKILNEKLNLNR